MLDKQAYSGQVVTFKKQWCNENDIIPVLLQEQLAQFLVEPILDVGAGMGDIALKAYPDKKTICIDLVIPADVDLSPPQKHKWVQVDFFSYEPTIKINTMVVSHTQQFLDENIQKLYTKIAEIDPKYIILVLNENDELFGDIVDYTLQHYPMSNPEVKIALPANLYMLIKRVSFTAKLSCNSFETLAEQIGYLMVNSTKEYHADIKSFLQKRLITPTLNINQAIEVYAKQG